MPPTEPLLEAATMELARRHLAAFVEDTAGVVLALLATGDGQQLVVHPRGLPIGHRLAAMTSSLHALADSIVRESGLPASRDLIIESHGGSVIVLDITSIGDRRVVMTVVAHGDTTVGSLLWAARECSARLQRHVFPSCD
jgi:predicted regulator of Ras-like GTPase activity (Roadblock/LC7/MglB family)